MSLRVLFRKSRILILCACAGLILVGGVAYAAFFSDAAHERASLNRLRICVSDPEDVLSCGREEVQRLLDGKKGGEVMSLLAQEITVPQCHTIGHLVGQEVYKRNRNLEAAITECGNGCTSSCMHGIIGEALIEEVGILGRDVDPRHLNVEFIRAAGSRLCQSRGMCHGVGHILFQIYNEFDQPLAICSEISKGGVREHCFRGVFMEHADTVSTHNLLLGTARKQLRDPKNLGFPCNSVAPAYQHACLRYLPRIHAQMIDEKILIDTTAQESVRLTCESFESPAARSACFEGYGFSFHELVRSEPNIAHRICDELSRTSDRVACTLGLIYSVADFGDTALSFSFCKDVAGSEERNMCYHAVFETVRFRAKVLLSFEEMSLLCTPSAGPECAMQLEMYSKNPWDTIFGVKNY